MATTDRTGATEPAEAVAARLREAGFAHLLVRADGAALAAAGVLAAACAETGTPYQVTAVRTRAELNPLGEPEADGIPSLPDPSTRIAVGIPGVDGPAARPSVAAFEVANAVGATPDPALALAGVVAGGGDPEAEATTILEDSGFQRRNGLAVPTADPVDGLAHTTFAHAPYSGDLEAVEGVVERLGDDERDRRLASLLAIDAVTAEGASERAAEAIERAVHPLAGGPFETVGGYADVLRALAVTEPGRAVALAVGGASEPTLDVWRRHAVAAHGGVRSAETEEQGGLLVARTEGPVEAVARLLRDYRSPASAVLAIGDGEAALATTDAPATPIEAAAEAADGSGLARGEFGYARVDAGREADLTEAVRGAI